MVSMQGMPNDFSGDDGSHSQEDHELAEQKTARLTSLIENLQVADSFEV